MKNNYGEEFRIQRKRIDITQGEVAETLGISVTSISNREKGLRDFTVVELYKAYKAFGINIGFGSVFDYIDEQSKKLESLVQHFSPKEKEKIHDKDYERMTMQTLEKLQGLLKVKSVNKEFSDIEMTSEEKIRLISVLIEFKRKDGDLKRAIELLEITVI